VSLRARLLLTMLVLAAGGLFVAGFATYGLVRSYLTDRVDQKLGPGVSGRAATYFFTQRIEGGTISGASQDKTTAGAVAGVGGPQLIIAKLNANGKRIAAFTGPGGTVTLPALPSGLPGSAAAPASDKDILFTLDDYRIRAIALPRGGTVVLAFPLDDLNGTLAQLLRIELAVGAAVLLLLGGWAWWLVRRELRPLEDMAHTADEIAAGDLSRRVEHTAHPTEVGHLGLALNGMLSRLEEAFVERQRAEDQLRRFVADASHELRTPLTSIRGYAELFRAGAEHRPGDLAMAMRRIEQEAARMGVLVDDLLLLARLDEGRPLRREAVDLRALAADAVADARAAEPARPLELDVNGPVVVTGDDARLRQVLGNLLANVRTHTPADAPASVRVRAADGEARLEVRDSGPGLDPVDAAQAFERFYRADASRHRSSGGSGLGLAIVQAVTEAHGGRAGVDSRPGEGAVFWVELPVYSEVVVEACAGATISPLVGSSSSSEGGRGSPAAS
jgi:two-component system OmpR family sensor kinase